MPSDSDRNGRTIKSDEKETKDNKIRNAIHLNLRDSDSLLVKYSAKKDYVALKNIFFMFVIGGIVHLLVRDIRHGKLISSGFRLIPMGFKGLYTALLMWIGLVSAALALHFCFHVWILKRRHIKSIISKNVWDFTFIVAYVFYVVSNFYFVGVMTLAYNLQFGSIIAIVSEMLRLLMKTYAYVRCNAPKVIPDKNGAKQLWNDSFSHYVFYLSVPTIVYKDIYERPASFTIRWSLIRNLVLEMCLSAFIMAMLYDLSYVPKIIEANENHSVISIIYISIETSVQGLILHFLLGYIILNCLQNIIAELMGFTDRAYYEDYWTLIHFSQFRKRTNLVIHEFFQNYVFSDLMRITNNNKTISQVICTLVSGLSHEFALSLFLQSFFPLITAQFVLGVVVFDQFGTNNPTLKNFILLFLLGFGTSTNVVAYTLKYCSNNGFDDYRTCLSYF